MRQHAKDSIADGILAPHSGIMKRLVPGLLIPLLLVLSACAAPRFAADVTQFHSLAPVPEPRSFVLIPLDEAKTESLEFASYASRVVNELTARGFRQVENLAQSDVVVRLDYGIGPGTAQSTPVPVYGYDPGRFTEVYGRTEEGKPFSAHIYETGRYVPLGYAEELRTVYRRELTLDILDTAEWRQGRTKKIYEGRAVSVGPEAEVARTVPLMIRTLFVDFPGPSGATRTIVLPEPAEAG